MLAKRRIAEWVAWSMLGAAFMGSWPSVRGDDIQFNRDIRPILAENCYRCHGPDPRQRKADLRLDRRESVLESEAVVPGDPDGSWLIDRIESNDPDEQMPPPASGKQLTGDQKRMLRQWIAAGAPYQAHWSYLSPERVPLPETATLPSRSPIDHWINAGLEKNKLQPSPPADPRTLLRRVYLDLLGLPPTLAQQDHFLADSRPDRYERLVDQLLESPHFGERMATAWLDVARYADTVGYHGDQNQNVFPFRDWVIGAINANVPFDQFTEYQLAGDLIEHPTTDSRVASCFNRLNMMTREGGAQPKEYLAKYSADRVRTVAGAWLGSTVGCAECHDHKFDPFLTRDFYSLSAFFADLQQWGVYQDYGYTPNPDLRGWSNDHPFPPEINVDVPYLKQRIENLRARVDRLARESWTQATASAASAPRPSDWQQSIATVLAGSANGWTVLRPTRAADAKGASIAYQQDDSGVIALESSEAGLVRFQFTIDQPLASIRLDLLPAPEGNGTLFLKSNQGRIVLRAATVDSDEKRESIGIAFADSPFRRPRYSNTFEILGIHDQWLIPDIGETVISGVWQLQQPWADKHRDIEIEISGDLPRAMRLSSSPLIPRDLQDPDAWRTSVENWMAGNEGESLQGFVARQWVLTTDGDPTARSKVEALERQIVECRRGQSPVQVSVSKEPMTVRVLPRGNWQDESGEIVTPQVPEFLGALPVPAGGRLSRLDLAHWLTSSTNPLTARVQMNRLWQHFFGEGLSAVLDDLGTQGQYPTHPELLDWLSVEFEESHWDFKHMVRCIVLSDAYQRSSQPTASAAEFDPKNQWLARQNPRRLEAEIIRDNALAAAELIQLDLGGPPVFPYQPENYYQHLQFPNRRYEASDDDRQYRRGIYTHWQRTFLHPMLANFDAPSREECTGMRTQANTPLQALTLLNDPTFVEAAKYLAVAVCASSDDDGKRIETMFRRVLCRDATPAERSQLVNYVQDQRESFSAHPAAARSLLSVGLQPLVEGDLNEWAAWTAACRAVLNLHESITRY